MKSVFAVEESRDHFCEQRRLGDILAMAVVRHKGLGELVLRVAVMTEQANQQCALFGTGGHIIF